MLRPPCWKLHAVERPPTSPIAGFGRGGAGRLRGHGFRARFARAVSCSHYRERCSARTRFRCLARGDGRDSIARCGWPAVLRSFQVSLSVHVAKNRVAVENKKESSRRFRPGRLFFAWNYLPCICRAHPPALAKAPPRCSATRLVGPACTEPFLMYAAI